MLESVTVVVGMCDSDRALHPPPIAECKQCRRPPPGPIWRFEPIENSNDERTQSCPGCCPVGDAAAVDYVAFTRTHSGQEEAAKHPVKSGCSARFKAGPFQDRLDVEPCTRSTGGMQSTTAEPVSTTSRVAARLVVLVVAAAQQLPTAQPPQHHSDNPFPPHIPHRQLERQLQMVPRGPAPLQLHPT